MPRASRTSAEPEREVTARLPCLATMILAPAAVPAAAATRAAAVEMLKVPLRSPPVPQVSTKVSRLSAEDSGMGDEVRRGVSRQSRRVRFRFRRGRRGLRGGLRIGVRRWSGRSRGGNREGCGRRAGRGFGAAR